MAACHLDHHRKNRRSSDADDMRPQNKEQKLGRKNSLQDKTSHEHGQQEDERVKPRKSKRASLTSETNEIATLAQDDKRRGRRKDRKSEIQGKGPSSDEEEVRRSERKGMRKKR